MTSPFAIGSSQAVIGEAYVASTSSNSSLSPFGVGTGAQPKVNILSDGSINHVPGRSDYILGASGTTAGTLSRIDDAVDGDVVTLWVEDDLLNPTTITVSDSASAAGAGDVDETKTFEIIVAGGDFDMKAGDALQIKYVASLKRWIEVARLWVSQSYADIAPEVDLIDADLLGGRPPLDYAAKGHLEDFYNGTCVEKFDARVTSDGVTVTMSLEKSGGGDLTLIFSSGQSTFDCTPAATIALTPGTDPFPQANFVYILESTLALTKSTTGWPSTEHNKIGHFVVPSASKVFTRGAYGNQNWNDYQAGPNGEGHMAHIAETIRHRGAIYFSGCEGVATQDGNDLWVSVAEGVVFQLHRHVFEALDSDTAGAGDVILVFNDPDDAYTEINSLNEITKHADGVAIGVNKYVTFVLWGVANKTGELELMMINLPTDEYNSVAAAARDVEGHTNFTIPREYALDAGTGFLIAAFVCKHTSTAMEIQQTIDLRGQNPLNVSGGGTGGGDVTAAAVIPDNAIARGDGGAKGIQGGTPSIADDGVMSVPGLGTGGYTDYDLRVGNVTTPDYGMIQMGNSSIGRTSMVAGAIDLDGTLLCRNISGPVTGDIEFIWTESTGGTARFALPKSGVGLATYNSRSMLLAGPAPADTDFVKVSYWQGLGIFHNLLCDTSGDGADLGVQNDLEVEGDIFADSILESTTAAGVTIDGVLLKDGMLTNTTIVTPTLTLRQSASPTPTTNGEVRWDNDDFKFVVGDGAGGQKFFSNDTFVLARANHTGTQAATTIGNGDVDDTELSYVNGVTSAIQTQLDAKGDVSAAANMSDHTLVRGDGGTKGVQDTGILVSDVDAVSLITKLGVDNLQLDANTLSSTNTNGDVSVTPDGTGVVNLGNAGDTVFGDATERAVRGHTDLASNLGSPTKRWNDLFAGGEVHFANLPTSDPTVAGQLWSNSGVVTVSAG